MTILVTGGAGFIGSHFVRRVIAGAEPELAGEPVRVLDAFTYAGRRGNLGPALASPLLDVLPGDVRDARLVRAALRGVRAVVHFAAESHVDRSIADGADFVTTNVVGTAVLLEAARREGVATVVHVSTDEVYGSIAHGSWPEDHPLAPNSPYAASKAGSDLLALAHHRTHGLDVRVTRCSNNYGPYQHPEKLVPRFTTRLLAGLPVPLYGDGRNVRDWLHVDDHCRAVARVLVAGRPGRVYNVGGGTELGNREIAEMLVELTGADPALVRRAPDRPGHDLRYSVDSRRIRDELGWEPLTPFREGLAATVAWYREHGDDRSEAAALAAAAPAGAAA